MISGRNPYKLISGTVTSGSQCPIPSIDIQTYTYNVGYYDDTNVLSYIDSLSEEVDRISRGESRLVNLLNSYVSQIQLHKASYVTSTELSAAGYITSIPSEYITSTELEGMGYLTSVPSEYVNENELNVVLSSYVSKKSLSSASYITMNDVSACGYLTQHQSLDDYVTVESLSSASYVRQSSLDKASYITMDNVLACNYVTEKELDKCSYVTDSVLEDRLSSSGYVSALSEEEMDELFPII